VFLWRGDERTDFFCGDAPRFLPRGHDTALEGLIVAKGESFVTCGVDQKREGQLRRAAAVIAPPKTGGAVIAKLQAERQGAGRSDASSVGRVVLVILNPHFAGSIWGTLAVIHAVNKPGRLERGEVERRLDAAWLFPAIALGIAWFQCRDLLALFRYLTSPCANQLTQAVGE